MITVDRKQFSRALAFSNAVIERRSQFPIMETVKANANGSLTLDSTDLDYHARVELPYDGDAQSFCISEPRGLLSAIKVAGGTSVSFAPTEPCHVNVSCGKLSSELYSPPVDDHPAGELLAEELFGCDVSKTELAQINRIRAAISKEKTRYYLNGVLVTKVGDWLYRFVATDGHRLMWVDIPLPSASGEVAPDTIIPRRFLEIALAQFVKSSEPVRFSLGRAAKKNTKDTELGVDSRSSRVSLASIVGGLKMVLTGKMIDGTYPDYNRAIPQDQPYCARLKRADLKQAVNALSPLTTCRTRAVKLTFSKKGLKVSLDSPEIGNSSFDIPAEHNLPKSFEIGFNGQYLLDMCGALNGDEIEFGLNDVHGPTSIKDPADTAFGAVLMPTRV